MKKLILVFIMVLLITGCSNNSNSSSESNKAINLDGTYEEVQESDTSTYKTIATIEGNKITILITLSSDTLNMEETFWIGSVEEPKNSSEPYTWISQRDQSAIEKAENPLPPESESIEFTYENDQLKYSFSNGGNQGDMEMILNKVK